MIEGSVLVSTHLSLRFVKRFGSFDARALINSFHPEKMFTGCNLESSGTVLLGICEGAFL